MSFMNQCRSALKPFVLQSLSELQCGVDQADVDPFVEYVCACFNEVAPRYPEHYVEPRYFPALFEQLKTHFYHGGPS